MYSCSAMCFIFQCMHAHDQCPLFCRRCLYVAVLVHFLSLLLAGIGVFAALFANHSKRDVSTTLSAGIYLILTATAGPYVVFKPEFVGKLKQCWWKFLIIGFADFYSIYLQTLAFNYTSMSSTQVAIF